MAIIWVLGAGGLVAAWVLGTPRLESYASAHQPGGDVVVRLVDLPMWVETDLETSIVQHLLTTPPHLLPDGPDQYLHDGCCAYRHPPRTSTDWGSHGLASAWADTSVSYGVTQVSPWPNGGVLSAGCL